MSFVEHLRLSVRDVAASRAFYDPWLRALGFAPVAREDDDLLAARAAPRRLRRGLRPRVDAVGEVLEGLGAEILQSPREYDHEPDCYAVFFLDPDGFKLEVIHAA